MRILAASVIAVSACSTMPVDDEVARLERTFWACDYVATTRGVGATPVVSCRHATEALKRAKFGGSFAAMLEWWKQNKAAEHSRLARTD